MNHSFRIQNCYIHQLQVCIHSSLIHFISSLYVNCSVTKDVARAVKAAKAGAVQFRVEKSGIVQAGIGKMSFKKEDILDNLRNFMVAVSDAKPDGLKGKYIVGVSLSSTMGPGVPLDIANVDPSSARFMLDPSKY